MKNERPQSTAIEILERAISKLDRERFWSKVDKNTRTGCWEWTAGLTDVGYGQFHVRVPGSGAKNMLAHRVAYTMARGEIGEGLQVDHLCRNRKCVNPKHLEAVTPRENTMRGVSFSALNAKATHCIRGHEFTEENTYRPRRGGRHCMRCKRDSDVALAPRYTGRIYQQTCEICGDIGALIGKSTAYKRAREHKAETGHKSGARLARAILGEESDA